MLTWVIGLLGAGVLAVANLNICPRGELIWAAAPWVAGIIAAVVGRIFGDSYRIHPGLRTAAEIYLAQLALARKCGEKDARDFFDRRSDDNQTARATRAQQCAHWCYRVALVLLALGIVFIFRRALTC